MNMKSNKKAALGLAGLIIAVAALSGCDDSVTTKAAAVEAKAQGSQQDIYNRIQPVPQFNGPSQQRETGFTVQRAQVKGSPSTTFIFNVGQADPFFECASIGYPIAATTESTNPQAIVGDNNNGGKVVIGAMDPNGTYPVGGSLGTYVGCLQQGGQTVRMDYYESTVNVIGAPATWDYVKHHIVVTGEATITVKKVNK